MGSALYLIQYDTQCNRLQNVTATLLKNTALFENLSGLVLQNVTVLLQNAQSIGRMHKGEENLSL